MNHKVKRIAVATFAAMALAMPAAYAGGDCTNESSGDDINVSVQANTACDVDALN